ncbi:hypothetical protein GQ56_0126620 [Burkholderia paludis]|nr:hypothetical protein GQ56_0126620 [Burkholderia paludis]
MRASPSRGCVVSSAALASGWTKPLIVVPSVAAPACEARWPVTIAPHCRFRRNVSSDAARRSACSASGSGLAARGPRTGGATDDGRAGRFARVRRVFGEQGGARRLLAHGGVRRWRMFGCGSKPARVTDRARSGAVAAWLDGRQRRTNRRT